MIVERLEGDTITSLVRKGLCIAFLVFLPVGSYAQNAVGVFRAIRGIRSTTRITRVAEVRINNFWVARDALASHRNYTNFDFTNTSSRIQLQVEQRIRAEQLKSPTTFYGPYNYMRAVSSVSRDQKLVNPRYAAAWKHLRQTEGYNGAHHLVMTAVIERIHADLKASGHKVSLSDLKNNAPCIFHPFHGRPEYQHIFHNLDEQYAIYTEHGMRALIVHQLELINDINIQIGLEPMPDWYIDGILKETKLWCNHFGLVYDNWVPVEGIK